MDYQPSITYTIYLDKLTQHLLRVQCIIKEPNRRGQIVALPVWVPGSYLIRDFAKHVLTIKATANNVAVPMQKITKNRWQCAPCTGTLTVEYLVYCFDQAARGAYVDHTRVFFDGCRVFLMVEDADEQTCAVKIVRPNFATQANWRCATSMTPAKIDQDGFGTYRAENHLELIDHPFEISDFLAFEFNVANTSHKLVVAGKAPADYPRLVQDLQKICQAQVDFFGELAPIRQYVFILSIVAKGWGGIEHRASCSLVATRHSLPKVSDLSLSEDYISLLGLLSHEYFHVWNVKRIKPEVFLNPDLNSEVYTKQLWMFEGVTAYYDNLNIVRAKVLPLKDYLKLLQDDMNLLLQTPGASVQTLEDASFDAWIKYYQPDENSINSAVSYYLKGCLVALALDLLIIKNSKRKQSLADIMQVLWQQFGKTGLGVPEDYFAHIVFEVTGEDYSDFFNVALRTTTPLEILELLQQVGIQAKPKAPSVIDNLGLKLNTDPRPTVRSVLYASAAEQAGIAPNDVLIAINNYAVTSSNIDYLITALPIEETLVVHVIRNDMLLELSMRNPPLAKSLYELESATDLSEQQKLNRMKWIDQ